MKNNKESEHPGQGSMARRGFIFLQKVLSSPAWGVVFAVVVAFLGAYWGAYYAIQEQQALHQEQAAALREVIRFEAEQNLKTLTKSTVNLRGAEEALEAFVKGDAPEPPIGPGYIGLATVGLRLHLESPTAYYIPPGLVGVYGLIYGRLTRYEEVRRDLDAAVIRYAAALTATEQRRAAANLLIRMRQQLEVSEALVQEKGLPVLLYCLDQFSAGADVCDYTLMETSEADGNTETGR